MQNPRHEKPLRNIPGGYGVPFFGAIKDRYDYFYNQGRDEFFRSKIAEHNSTVLRSNMPPGPFIARNPRVIVLLDAASFPVLFDTTKIEKRDVFVGTYMPSTSFTGGHRVCSYLDTSEQAHFALKSFILNLLASRHNRFVPLLQAKLSDLFDSLESELSNKKEVEFNGLSDKASFAYAFELFCGRNLSDTALGSEGNKLVDKWLFPQVVPLATLGLPKALNFLEDLLLHTFPLPPFLVKSNYSKVFTAFRESAKTVLDEAEQMFGIERDEACHNLVFLVSFNAYGGFKVLFPSVIKWVGLAGETLHRRLAAEVRAAVKNHGGLVTLAALETMSLVKSTVYEVMRIEPPVPFQYGHAKRDLVIESHDSAFEVKKGEMVFGYQPFATKDGKVFANPDEFVADRFVGEEGERLLKYVLWSNGRETDDPAADDKQCPAKDFVVLVARVLVAEFFLRFDTFEVEAGTLLLGSKATIKSLTKASS